MKQIFKTLTLCCCFSLNMNIGYASLPNLSIGDCTSYNLNGVGNGNNYHLNSIGDNDTRLLKGVGDGHNRTKGVGAGGN